MSTHNTYEEVGSDRVVLDIKRRSVRPVREEREP
jgi:hypothetical protein